MHRNIDVNFKACDILGIWSSSGRIRNSYNENIHQGPMVVDTEGSSVLLNSYLKNPKYTKIKKWNNVKYQSGYYPRKVKLYG